MDNLTFRQALFIQVLGMQLHPRKWDILEMSNTEFVELARRVDQLVALCRGCDDPEVP